ncbi:ATP-binding cassette domain-containing protein [Shigella flexneri]
MISPFVCPAHAFASAVVKPSCRESDGLIGHNGSGESTLLKMLAVVGLRGRGKFSDAQPLEGWSSKAFCRKVAYSPQQLPPAEGLTMRELVAMVIPSHRALARSAAADRAKSRGSYLAGWLKTAGASAGRYISLAANVDMIRHAGGAG